jgi:hypothetical protein
MSRSLLAVCLVLAALVGRPLLSAAGEAAAPIPPLHRVPVTGRLADGGTFRGQLTLEALTVDDDGPLRATGALTGTARPTAGRPITLPAYAFTAPAAVLDLRGTCTTVILDLQPLIPAPLGQALTLVPLVLGPPGPSKRAHRVQTALCALARLQELPDDPRPPGESREVSSRDR